MSDADQPTPDERAGIPQSTPRSQMIVSTGKSYASANVQASRHVKCACPACGYVVRTARKWIDQAGAPHCPQHGPMQADVATEG